MASHNATAPAGRKSLFSLVRTKVNKFFQDFWEFLKSVLSLFRLDFCEAMLFILFCTIFTAFATSILKKLLFGAMMWVSGETYIAPANAKHVFFHPVSIVLMIIFAVIITLFSLFEIAGLLHTFSVAKAGYETNLTCMFLAGFRACRKALNPRNWPLILFVLVLFPLTKVLPLSSSTFKLILPGFVNQTIDYTRWLNLLYNAAYLTLIIFLTVYVFSINSFILQKESFFKSCSKSRKLVKGHFVEILLTMFLLTIILNFLINSISSVIVVNGKEAISFLKGDSSIVSKTEDVGTYTYVLRQILRSIISPAINNAALTALFYKYLDEKSELNTVSEDILKVKHYTKQRTALVLAALGVMSFGILVAMTYKYAFLMEDVDRPLVCAHRGDNVNAPENTMPAFELAASENLKWIELDVHQTSDGIIICNHDQTIKRVTGRNLSIHDHTYKELSEFELGDWMPGDYEDVHIATLKEALEMAKENDMNVQVELKGHPDDLNFEENVLKIINETDMRDNVMIISQDASRLERVAELDPAITKGYCMFLAMGELDDIEYTDNITIEETYVTPELVRDMHEKGIMVFCWTVDRDETVQYLVSCDVDVIGTDDPMLITDALDKADYSGGFSRAFHIVMHMIAHMDK
ncbi:MAG: glycerophosphoryl diester phosphodiesterase membrane domain-containing protein [Clostridiales bacterium]|nr:glycerophosphoryl diester phosphodiesterase membrane domain-containing protein [Clostridiales bacterium]